MNDENTKKLAEAFPRLYRNLHATPEESCLSFGFECGDGWCKLLFDLSTELAALPKEIVAGQVKEKFGTLRFYLDTSVDEAEDIIRKYEEISSKTCELCGKSGSLCQRKGWLATMCPECAKAHAYTRTKESGQ